MTVKEKIAKINSILETTILIVNIALLDMKDKLLSQLGKELVELGCDEKTNGGFWLWKYKSNEVYASPKFCKSLGYDYEELGNDFNVFNIADKSELKIGVDKIKELIGLKSNDTFVNDIHFTKKDGTKILIECNGKVFYREDNPYVILGTHKIL